jgi:hypothetical protein
LQEVVLNLVVNAVQAMDALQDGAREVLVTTSHAEPNGVLVAVEDSVSPDRVPETAHGDNAAVKPAASPATVSGSVLDLQTPHIAAVQTLSAQRQVLAELNGGPTRVKCPLQQGISGAEMVVRR